MKTARSGDTMTVLSDGRVLEVGGVDSSGNILASAELYDPATGKWSLTGSMKVARENHKAALLSNGKVLVMGGINVSGGSALTSAELYNPATGTWSLTGSMNVARENHTAVPLMNGQVLVAGGDTGEQDSPDMFAIASAELYNPAAGTWTLTGSMHTKRIDPPSLRLADGKVLVAGGDDGAGFCCLSSPRSILQTNGPLSPCFCPHSVKSAELYNPATGTWTVTGKMNVPRVFHTMTGLLHNMVLVAGGLKCTNIFVGNCRALATAEVYSESTGTWTLTGSMSIARLSQAATRLLDGQVLVAGGNDLLVNVFASAELYNPSTGAWGLTGSMIDARANFNMRRLSSGMVLVAGGGIASSELYTP